MFSKFEMEIHFTHHMVDEVKITVPTRIRFWRSNTMFNWNDYSERGKASFYHVTSLTLFTTVSSQLFFCFLFLQKTAVDCISVFLSGRS